MSSWGERSRLCRWPSDSWATSVSQIVLSGSPPCDDRGRVGVDLKCAGRAAEAAQDREVRCVPFVRDTFPVRDHPLASASGDAVPVVPAGRGDVERIFAAQRRPVICCADLESPARAPDRNHRRMFPSQRILHETQGSRDLPHCADESVRDRPPRSRDVGARVEREFACSPFLLRAFLPRPLHKCLSRIPRKRCRVIGRSPVDGPLLHPAGLPVPLDAGCRQDLFSDRRQRISGQFEWGGVLEYELTVNFLYGDVDVRCGRTASIADE